MDNQNNVFSNMIQPSGIPEVKDNSVAGQGNSFVNNVQSNNLNQVSGTFGIPQSSTVPNNGSMQPSSEPILGNNNNSFINNGSVGATVELNNNVGQQTNNSTLDFSMPGENVNNNLNVIGGINSNLNNNAGMVIEQPQLQPVNDSIDLGTGVNNNVGSTTIVDNGLNMEMINNLSGNSLVNEMANSANAAAEINSNANHADGGEEVVSVKKYLIHMLLCSIPVVGIILLIIRAIDRKDKNISNLARAQLLLSAIIVLLSVVLTFIMGTMIASVVSNI